MTPKKLGGLGFRDFTLFNQAMPGRQGWRLLTEPESLCARVLKGRYFPNCDFSDAPKPKFSCYTWRSILFGRELLKKGVQWRIADGKTIKITTDFWIPEVRPYAVHTLLPIPVNATVKSLMVDRRRAWNEETVRTFFPVPVADCILQTQINRHGESDYVSWPHTRFGEYTVRSAYNLVRSADFFTEQSCTGRGLPSEWKLKRNTGRPFGRSNLRAR